MLVVGVAHDYSLHGMLKEADPVVKAVMLGLALASVGCWAIILEKLVRLSWLRRQVRRLEAVAKSGSISDDERGLVRTLLMAAHDEAEDGASRGEDRSAVRARSVVEALRMLMELARGREYEVFDRSIDVQVSRLRKLVERDPGHPAYIQTVWGFGYVFVPDGAPQ